MANVAWDLLAQYPNAGEAFSHAFQTGMQQNALSNLAMNPTDPAAQAGAARYDPSTVMQLKLTEMNQQQQQTKQAHDEWIKYAGNLAKWADTPQKRDQAIDYLAQSNHPDISTQDLMALKKLSPEQWTAVRANFMAQAGVQDQQPTELQRNVEYMNGQQPGLGDSYLQNEADKLVPIQTSNPDGTITVNWVRPPMNTGTSTIGRGQPSAPPAAAVAALKANPQRAAEFDQKYGHGAAAAALGNGGQSGASSTGGF